MQMYWKKDYKERVDQMEHVILSASARCFWNYFEQSLDLSYDILLDKN